jgi:VanZ family protein
MTSIGRTGRFRRFRAAPCLSGWVSSSMHLNPTSPVNLRSRRVCCRFRDRASVDRPPVGGRDRFTPESCGFPMLDAPGYRRFWRAALLAFILVVCWLTLRPQGWIDPTVTVVENAAADFLRNGLLLAPFGLLAAISGLRTRHVVLASLGFATGIEFAQGFIPGRFSSLSDVAANTLGASLAAWLWQQRGQLRRPPAAASFVVAACAIAVPVLAGVLFRPALPVDRHWHALFTPDLDTRYRGRVLEASLGPYPLVPGRALPAERLASALTTTLDVSVTFVAANPPSRRAVLVRLYDDDIRELVDLAIDQTDIVFRLRTVSEALRFDEPVLRWRESLAGVRAGDTVRMQLQRHGGETCLTIQRTEGCSALRARDAWMTAAPERSVSGGTGQLVGWFFLAMLIVPSVLLGGTRAGTAACVLVVAGLAILPPVAGLAPMSLGDWVATACGVAFGVALRSLLGRYASTILGPDPPGTH